MRDNSKRLTAGADPAPAAVPEMASTLNFSTPTEIVDLPSRGKHYPEGHPLHGAESVEIKFMTAKDEDILTSPTLLKKGMAIDRFIQNVLVNKRINVQTLLSGDKNAILVASRINGFGADYSTKVTCPACSTTGEHTFDLAEITEYLGDDYGDYEISTTEEGTYIISLPKSQFQVEVRLLTSRDENELVQLIEASKKKKKIETSLTDQLRKIIVSINGVEDRTLINKAVDALPAFDSRYLRGAYQKIVPGLNMRQDFTCSSCGFEEEVDVPMTVDFFWSKQ